MDFKNKTAIITGGGTGIGAAVAKKIAEAGGNVVLVGRRIEPLEAVAKDVGGLAIAADAADKDAMKGVLDQVIAKYGQLDVLVANAGGGGVGPTLEMSDEVWAGAVRSNLNTLFVAARTVLPELIKSRGAIVVVSSIAGLFSGPNAAGYVTMKHACIGLAKSLARDFGRKGVNTNTVCPGWVRTPLADGEMAEMMEIQGLTDVEEAYKLATKDVPINRPATPMEVANVIAFLASGDAAMVNGAVVTVDGGATTVDLPTLGFVED
ncbi:SDR family NAD(P)-dependent oxidoreductase [Cucumibacter marinus]|uniref:SDR family NAD(P)-dependent oxidoreductase n=1 Tax=Cucumibacter marinus TaxID=1121252 RepID=UPI000428E16D|nr:SDR family oxidoreductase [Cucumibacter marinus]